MSSLGLDFPNLMLQFVHLAPHIMQFLMVMDLKHVFTLRFEFLNFVFQV